MDPFDRKQLKQLVAAINGSYRELESYRRKRIESIRQYVGSKYSANGAPVPVPVNTIQRAIDIYTYFLTSQNPRVLVTTPHRSLKVGALDVELCTNQVLKEMRFKTQLRRVVKEAMVCVGVFKIGIAESRRGFSEDPGELYGRVIDPDDWVQDTSARAIEESHFLGNRSQLTEEDFRSLYPGIDEQTARETREASGDDPYAEDESARSIGRGSDPFRERSQRYRDVWDIWLPEEGVVVTLLGARSQTEPVSDKLLRVVRWTGPKTGPFKILSFSDVPGNLMPLAPVDVLRDLHDLINTLYIELGQGAVAEKTIIAYQGDASDDAARMVNAANQKTVRVDNLQGIKPVTFGGASERGMAFGIHVSDIQNEQSGNVNALGGLGPQADTLGQERLISQNASLRVRAMQDAVSDFTLECIESIAYYELSNPLISRVVVRRVPIVGVEVVTELDAERVAPILERWRDLNFEISHYSMQPRTPFERWSAVVQLMQQVVLPLQQQYAEQGQAINVDGLARTCARLLGVEAEYEDIVTSATPPSIATRKMVGEDPRPPQLATAPKRPPAPPRLPQQAGPNGRQLIGDMMRRPRVSLQAPQEASA